MASDFCAAQPRRCSEEWAALRAEIPGADRAAPSGSNGVRWELMVGGTTFALLAPRSLHPAGHLRCASSVLPRPSVVASDFCAA